MAGLGRLGFITSHEHQIEATAEFGVSPGDLKALTRLSSGQGESMSTLATTWRCDASTVTWIVNRLEQRGLVERQPHKTDRRVKVVALMKVGEKLRKQLHDQGERRPKAFETLSSSELETLHQLVMHSKRNASSDKTK